MTNHNPPGPRRWIGLIVLILVAVVGLAACQGGGGSPSATPPPSATAPAASPTTPVGSPTPPTVSPTRAASPAGATPTGASSGQSGGITITAPQTGSMVRSPVLVQGLGRGFEGNLVIEVRDAAGKVLGQGTAQGGALGTPEPYRAMVSFTPPASAQPGEIVVYTRSARDGSVQESARVEVILVP